MKPSHRYRFSAFTAIIFIFLTGCYKEIELSTDSVKSEYQEVKFNEAPVAYDTVNKIMLFSIEQSIIHDFNISIYSEPFRFMQIDDKIINDKNSYQFAEVNTEDEYTVKVQYSNGEIDYYFLQFTTLPIVQVFTDYTIPDEPKISSWIIISNADSDEKIIKSYAGIEVRGGHAVNKMKKSYAIEFWNDAYESDHRDISFYGLLPDDDWILDAMYIDKARMRKALSYQIWASMQYNNDLRIAKTGVDGGFVELFNNRQFIGLFNLTERIDRKRLDLKRSDATLEGLIFKAKEWDGPTIYSVMIERYGGLQWGGWDLKYPKNIIEESWVPFHDYIDFVVNSVDEVFREDIFEYIDMNNSIDYYIFLNIVKAIDNWGKNIIMARYENGSPFIIIPWDLDATWGRSWESSLLDYGGILTNGLYDRLIDLSPDNFKNLMIARWWVLRSDILTEAKIFSIMNGIESELISSGASNRETNAWPESELNLEEEINYIQQWTSNRLNYLDNYFENL